MAKIGLGKLSHVKNKYEEMHVMKIKKKTALLISFTAGLLLIATTALADIANKNGYVQLKDSVKFTAESCGTSLNSFTMNATIVLKDNGVILASENSITKYDRLNGSSESQNESQRINGKNYTSYSYSDKTTDIRHHSDDEKYYVTEYIDEKEEIGFTNPFKEEEAADLERILDALVGNLQDHVSVRENLDGSKELYGSLNEVQIPALVNAIASFQLKQEFSYQQRDSQQPKLTEDIFVKGVGGSAQVNPDGLLESILGTATISGKDAQGNIHEMTLDVLFRLTDINSTVITKPDLSDKNVVKQEGKTHTSPYGHELVNPEKYIGSYKNDIIMEKDGRFVKIGERHLKITQLNNSTISGSYTEEYREGYEEYAANKMEFSFSGNFENDFRNVAINLTDSTGSTENGNIYIDEYNAKINFYLNRPYNNLEFDSTFSPDLD